MESFQCYPRPGIALNVPGLHCARGRKMRLASAHNCAFTTQHNDTLSVKGMLGGQPKEGTILQYGLNSGIQTCGRATARRF